MQLPMLKDEPIDVYWSEKQQVFPDIRNIVLGDKEKTPRPPWNFLCTAENLSSYSGAAIDRSNKKNTDYYIFEFLVLEREFDIDQLSNQERFSIALIQDKKGYASDDSEVVGTSWNLKQLTLHILVNHLKVIS